MVRFSVNLIAFCADGASHDWHDAAIGPGGGQSMERKTETADSLRVRNELEHRQPVPGRRYGGGGVEAQGDKNAIRRRPHQNDEHVGRVGIHAILPSRRRGNECGRAAAWDRASGQDRCAIAPEQRVAGCQRDAGTLLGVGEAVVVGIGGGRGRAQLTAAPAGVMRRSTASAVTTVRTTAAPVAFRGHAPELLRSFRQSCPFTSLWATVPGDLSEPIIAISARTASAAACPSP